MPSPADGIQPRFFVEVNQVFTVFGLNLFGFAPGLLAGAMLMGLGQFGLFFLVMLASFRLARKMAVEEKWPNEVAAHVRHPERFIVAGGSEPELPILVRTSGPVPVAVSHWLAARIESAESQRLESYPRAA